MKRLVLQHPVVSVVVVALVIGAVGFAIDTLGGPSGGAESTCSADPGEEPVAGRQQQAATLDYRRLWRRAAPLLGSEGQPHPRLRFVGQAAPRPGSDALMWTGPDENGCRAIFIPPGARALLARVGKSKREQRLHRAAERWTVHETAHIFQSNQVLSIRSLREFGATAWEKSHARQVLGKRKGRPPPPFNQWRDRDQFGPNYGGNPLTFVWPPNLEPLQPEAVSSP